MAFLAFRQAFFCSLKFEKKLSDKNVVMTNFASWEKGPWGVGWTAFPFNRLIYLGTMAPGELGKHRKVKALGDRSQLAMVNIIQGSGKNSKRPEKWGPINFN